MTCTTYESPTDFQGDDDNILFAIDTSVYGVDTIQDLLCPTFTKNLEWHLTLGPLYKVSVFPYSE